MNPIRSIRNWAKTWLARDKIGGTVGYLTTQEAWEDLTCSGYTRLADNAEVQICVHKIADLISSMTLHLMHNTPDGDMRERNALARKVDVEPCSFMTRKGFIYYIVRSMLLEGDGNAYVIPEYSGEYLEDMKPVPPDRCTLLPDEDGEGYAIMVGGATLNSQEMLHFVMNPHIEEPWKGQGYRVQLRDIVQNLKQAGKTKNAFMASEWKPSLIVRVDSLADELSEEEGRDKILERYVKATRAGQPWIIPASLFEVQSVKPLSLNDLAINESVELDKKTVAGIFGVPAFFLGVGSYDKDEYNGFISTVILPFAKALEQEFTKKLLYSQDYYFRFNPRSLYTYAIPEMATVAGEMVDRMIMDRNEARDWLGLPPREGLSELIILENYLPVDRLGDQKKLVREVIEEWQKRYTEEKAN